MIVDKRYCSCAFLQVRTLAGSDRCFSEKYKPNLWQRERKPDAVNTSEDLVNKLQDQIDECCSKGKVALALSGGIDSAVLAKCMPKGSTAYTFKCTIPGMSVTDETPRAKNYASECGLDHRIVNIYWEDFEKYAPVLMKHKGAPIHSIEVQIYKAALQALKDGFDTIIFGESADLNYGGLSDLLSKERTVGEFIDRYNYVHPYYVLKDPLILTKPFENYVRTDGTFDTHEFCRGIFLHEAMGSYSNACECAGIKLITPYVNTWLGPELDYERIRSGENKYIIRDAFKQLYPGYIAPPKTPMPRPMDEWMSKWEGPQRPEFWPNCTSHMKGDQKWLVWALEKFLNLIDE